MVDVDDTNILFGEEKGSSLIAVLIILTILSFLIGSVMMGMIIQSRFIERDVDQLQARYSAEAGIFHFLSDTALSALTQIDSLQVQLIDSNDVAQLDIRPFGGFLQITSTAKSGNQSKTIRTLAGEKAPTVFQQAVVLGDIRSTLNVAGSTTVNGGITVGPRGVKQSPFKGKLFEGSIQGKIRQEEKSMLPDFDKSLFDFETAYCNSLLRHPPPEAIRLNAGKIDLSRQMPELEEQAIVYVKGNLELTASPFSEVELPEAITFVVTGNLLINGIIEFKPFSRFIAGNNLTVSGKLAGDHGLFYAKNKMEVTGEEPLSGQFLAGKNITITGSTYLKYPSVVYLNESIKQDIREGRLEVSGSSTVEGMVLIPAPEKVINEDKSRLVIGKSSEVRGAIYNTGQTELHGKVSGSVLTMQFYFYQSPTAYINWLKDVSISLKDRPDNYVVPLGFSEKRKYELLAWEEL